MKIQLNPASRPCACGKKDQHSLREAGQCDWKKRTPAEQNAIIAKQKAAEEAA